MIVVVEIVVEVVVVVVVVQSLKIVVKLIHSLKKKKNELWLNWMIMKMEVNNADASW